MRIVIGIEYEGSLYRGWQRQLKVESVQEHLERSISQIAVEPIKLFCAGRTDAGVHAIGQVAHFDTMAVRAESSWIRGTNSNLPRTIKVGWARVIPETFHARFSAIARHYRYIIDNGSTPPALLGNGVLYYPWPLEVELMHQAGQYLVGEHDFSAFRAVQCQSNSPWRNLMQLSVTRIGRYVALDLKANAFVHHMVRNIVGVLLKVGSGERSPSWVADLLASRDRTQGADTAKAHGLYLVKVDYPATFNIPTDPAEHLFLMN